MLLRVLLVFLVIAALQQATVDLRVQRLHTSIEHLWKAGVLRHIRDLEAAVLEVLGGAPRGKQLHPERRQAFGEVEKAGFIGNRKQGAGDGHVCLGRKFGAGE